MESLNKVSVILATKINGNLKLADLKNVTYEARSLRMHYHMHTMVTYALIKKHSLNLIM